MSNLRMAAQQALDALVKDDRISGYPNNKAAIATLQTALAQPDVPDEQARGAERYRWLRHALSDNGPNGKSHWFCSISAGHPEELDSAIDAAMKGGEA